MLTLVKDHAIIAKSLAEHIDLEIPSDEKKFFKKIKKLVDRRRKL